MSDERSESMAHLYVWDCILSILEGGANPGREDEKSAKAVEKVVGICKAQMQHCLRKYDAAVDKGGDV